MDPTALAFLKNNCLDLKRSFDVDSKESSLMASNPAGAALLGRIGGFLKQQATEASVVRLRHSRNKGHTNQCCLDLKSPRPKKLWCSRRKFYTRLSKIETSSRKQKSLRWVSGGKGQSFPVTGYSVNQYVPWILVE
jgi:hypothetical protein